MMGLDCSGSDTWAGNRESLFQARPVGDLGLEAPRWLNLPLPKALAKDGSLECYCVWSLSAEAGGGQL